LRRRTVFGPIGHQATAALARKPEMMIMARWPLYGPDRHDHEGDDPPEAVIAAEPDGAGCAGGDYIACRNVWHNGWVTSPIGQ
jgi:hypothetical protein